MKRILITVLATLLVVALIGAGVYAWLVTRQDGGSSNNQDQGQSQNQSEQTEPQTDQPQATNQELKLYFVKLGNDDSGGIGCGDEIEDVEVEVTTTAPLRASVEELLKVDTETYPGTNLHNALWQSDLRVDDASINGDTARVELSGQLRLAGTCDSPRIEAQLERTATDAANVSQVEITVNGQPLEAALSQR